MTTESELRGLLRRAADELEMWPSDSDAEALMREINAVLAPPPPEPPEPPRPLPPQPPGTVWGPPGHNGWHKLHCIHCGAGITLAQEITRYYDVLGGRGDHNASVGDGSDEEWGDMRFICDCDEEDRPAVPSGFDYEIV